MMTTVHRSLWRTRTLLHSSLFPSHHPDTALYQKELRQLQAESTKRWQQEIPDNSDIYVLSRSLKLLQVPKPGEEEWDQCVEQRYNHR